MNAKKDAVKKERWLLAHRAKWCELDTLAKQAIRDGLYSQKTRVFDIRRTLTAKINRLEVTK